MFKIGLIVYCVLNVSLKDMPVYTAKDFVGKVVAVGPKRLLVDFSRDPKTKHVQEDLSKPITVNQDLCIPTSSN